jgi:hypothetical protein
MRSLTLLIAGLALTVAGASAAALNRSPEWEPEPRATAPAPPPNPVEQSLARPEPDPSRRIVIARDMRMLWLVEGADTLLKTRVAVGSMDTLSYGKQSWRFETPQGVRSVRGKEANPVWVPPLWHFVERAREAKRPLVELKSAGGYAFPDGSRVVVRGGKVGHLLANGAFIPTEVGDEVVINGILFVPPLGSENRRVAGELGAYKLDLGDGYLIHGTPHKDSLGKAATHGCIRVGEEALKFLFENVSIGTRVHIL